MSKIIIFGLILLNANLALAGDINSFLIKYFNVDEIKNINSIRQSDKINVFTSCHRCEIKSFNDAKFLPIQENIVDVTMLFNLDNYITKVLLLKLSNNSVEFVNYFKVNKNIKIINIRLKQNCPDTFITLLMYVESVNKILYGDSTTYFTSCEYPGF